jgi:hypothetical protein
MNSTKHNSTLKTKLIAQTGGIVRIAEEDGEI